LPASPAPRASLASPRLSSVDQRPDGVPRQSDERQPVPIGWRDRCGPYPCPVREVLVAPGLDARAGLATIRVRLPA
jgi:hypothetical protein